MAQMIGGDKLNTVEKKQPNQRKDPPKAGFAILIAVYILTSFFVTRVAVSQDTINLFGIVQPVSAFPGGFSSLANITLIFLVMFYKKPGFVVSLCFLLIQIPMLAQNFFLRHTPTSLPGLFNVILTAAAILMIYRRNRQLDEYQKNEVDFLRDQHKVSRRLFEQTATALVNAIEAKDKYSHGHSIRVAEYSEMLARELKKSESECRKIYYAALLHDVGKIGVPIRIINKKGRLTEEEYARVKEHPVMGNQILSGISEYPYLAVGAHYHHERYDGKGYPDGLKGDEIPEIARIISVADAYDAMSSNRSYRMAIPQQLVREEIIKGIKTQFDPDVAEAMVHLIDMDVEYDLREKSVTGELNGQGELVCHESRSDITDGIRITDHMTKIRLKSKSLRMRDQKVRGVTLVLFDSLDGRYHEDEQIVKDLCYFEYGEVWLSGKATGAGARKVAVDTVSHRKTDKKHEDGAARFYEIEAVRVKDHILLRVDDGETVKEITYALQDSSRFSYIGITGENCRITDIHVITEKESVPENYIKRIAEEISYIKGKSGDIPNLQVDGYRTAASKGIPLDQNLTVSYHTMSLPTARLVWHCTYFVLYTSDDGTVGGPNYREYSLLRPDGERWESDGGSKNDPQIRMQPDFAGWEAWKTTNKAGFDSQITFTRDKNVVVADWENLGITIHNTTTILENAEKLYVAVTGDQCAVTNIRITS